MFEFISDYFKNREEKQQPTKQFVEKTSNNKLTIHYDPNLIDSLEADHVKLVELFGRIWSEGFGIANYQRASTLISQFKTDFQAHLLTENVKFYVYLEQALVDDKHNLSIVKEFRTDMNDIANAAIKFCKTYQGTYSEAMLKSFKADYKAVGEVLTHRVSLEEKSLYVLYQPH